MNMGGSSGAILDIMLHTAAASLGREGPLGKRSAMRSTRQVFMGVPSGLYHVGCTLSAVYTFYHLNVKRITVILGTRSPSFLKTNAAGVAELSMPHNSGGNATRGSCWEKKQYN